MSMTIDHYKILLGELANVSLGKLEPKATHVWGEKSMFSGIENLNLEMTFDIMFIYIVQYIS